MIFNKGYYLNFKGKKAEEFVNELAKKSFLIDWCYPNPKLPNGKEICDLLIVFEDVIIIWQIKDLKLNKNGKYNESKIKKNLKQLITAKNRLFNQNIKIELENSRKGKEIFNRNKIKRVYLISALLGEEQEYFSLDENMKGNLIHTFTREFTETVLNELDTVKDFVEYLEEKEKLISSKLKIIINNGEKNLLAYYLMNQRTFKKLMDKDIIIIQEGLWEDLQKKPEYLRKKKENEISYLWDEIINKTHTAGKNYEIVARELARLNRFERRVLSKAFFEAHVLAHNEKKKNHFRRIIKTDGTTYCFVFMNHKQRELRKKLLQIICFIARGVYKENEKVVGIATEMKIEPFCSYDFCLLEMPSWTEKEESEMKRLQKKTKILLNPQKKNYHEEEYPQ